MGGGRHSGAPLMQLANHALRTRQIGVPNASCYEVKLAASALHTMRAPRQCRGRAKQRPEKLVADNCLRQQVFQSIVALEGDQTNDPTL